MSDFVSPHCFSYKALFRHVAGRKFPELSLTFLFLYRWTDAAARPLLCTDPAMPPGNYFNPNSNPVDLKSIPFLPSASETSDGLKNVMPSHQLPQPIFTNQTRHESYKHSQHSDPASTTDPAWTIFSDLRSPHTDCHVANDDGEEGRKGHVRPPEAENGKEEDSILLYPEYEGFHLPRSSPVISKRCRSLSYHAGAADKPAPSSPVWSIPAQCEDKCGRWTITSRDFLGSIKTSCHPSSQEDNKPRSVSSSLLSTGLHLPFNGHQELAAPPTPDQRSSNIPEFSADIFKTSCELEKENAHFVVVDLVLEVLEGVNGFEDCVNSQTLTGSFRKSLWCPMMQHSAELLAQQLVLDFRRSWLPSQEPQHGRRSLHTSLQELSGGRVAVHGGSLTEEIRLRTRMRGTQNWAPPRFQIIFTLQPTHRRSDVVALQHFLCAGCGTEVEPRYIKKLRYCEYLGKYFCDCCHSGSEAVIPARVLSCWDFSRYPVSDFSRQLLDSVWLQPLFDLTSTGKMLYSRVRELDRFRELQEQLLGIKKLLTACRLSEGVMNEFEQLPGHLTQQPHLFSMDDLFRVKKGQLVVLARTLLLSATNHVENCELCLARGFICEFCRERDIIFPFQSDRCRRCSACKACFHKHCFVERKCPKCARIQSRREVQDGSMEGDI
ncbi:hypothetical protein LDENG_00117590 [Lucifuga dentata]|nr:hypothetical protein LDENG_00117590 [Lucifuga dentata]